MNTWRRGLNLQFFQMVKERLLLKQLMGEAPGKGGLTDAAPVTGASNAIQMW